MNTLYIYIDGASRGNPGPAGIGIVLGDEKNPGSKRMCKYIGETTNNVAEYTALIYSLQEALILRAEEVVIHTDSELLAKQLDGHYKVKDPALRSLYEQFLHLKGGFQQVIIKQIDRQKNPLADSLANEAIETRINTDLKYK